MESMSYLAVRRFLFARSTATMDLTRAGDRLKFQFVQTQGVILFFDELA